MKLIKFIGKTVFTFLAITYAVCLINGITVIEYYETDDGGTLSVIGRSIEINNGIANSFWEAYTKAETKAAEWLPAKIKNAVEKISDLLETGS